MLKIVYFAIAKKIKYATLIYVAERIGYLI